MLILEPVNSTISQVLSFKVCRNLCSLHSVTGVGETGEYLGHEIDRQVGLGMLGLANLLRSYGVTYEQFGRALENTTRRY